MTILGISAFYHDSAAALVHDGRLVAAAQEERFSRVKHDFRFPRQAIAYCLAEAGLDGSQLDLVAFYDKPLLKFERILESHLAYAPRGVRAFRKAMPVWLKQKLWMDEFIRSQLGYRGKIIYPEHHLSHAASAFFPSPFAEAAILVADGVGEWATTTYGVGREQAITLLGELRFPHSLGLLYSAFTYYLGFRVNSGEHKVMGLAPYGEPRYVELILGRLIDLKEDGSFRVDMGYFDYAVGLVMTNRRFARLFGGPPRRPEGPLSQRHMDIARSIQWVTEEIVLRMARHLHRQTGQSNLCLAGGCALNCVANGRLLREGPFRGLWIQPAAGDAGAALGAALAGWHMFAGRERHAAGVHDRQQGSYLGPAFSNEEIERYLTSVGAVYQRMRPKDLAQHTAALLERGQVVGWFQGRMEFGPRALGNRSILADARLPAMQEVVNQKIKFRESFRPLAPSVLEEFAGQYFELDCPSPYMLVVAPVVASQRLPLKNSDRLLAGIERRRAVRSTIPAVTHVDYSSRVHTVEHTCNPRFAEVIEAFRKKTGCPVVINTSFNVRGEPIVCTPEDAYLCFMNTDMDYLVMGDFVLDKKRQTQLAVRQRRRFALD
ncbi:MAG: carbamoyltransferase [bacterium]|nr:carbamoyltransferase [candidate division KSB1 bacterium]MDH7559952.1 carbamoyltransferase [bacterium]